MNDKKNKFYIEKSTKLSTYFALTTSILTTAAMVGIALYALYFLQEIFGHVIFQYHLENEMLLFKSSLERIVLAFIVMGLVASYYMTKSVTKPLEDLMKGSHELAEGNLENRIKKTQFLEINELIDDYNNMAQKLQTLYDNLEDKVAERTKALAEANSELKSTQSMIVHSEKMRSLGQLVAGITHEINNPINFVWGNLTYLKKYAQALFELISVYETCECEIDESKLSEINKLKEKIELSFIKEDLPSLIRSCEDGVERTKNIVADLKNFSRIDEKIVNQISISKEIDTILNILNNKIKNRIEVVKEYEDIPQIEGYGGQLNQVFMNILDNACYAIEGEGKIYIRLKKSKNNVIIEIEDTGSGMSQEQVEKIFEPFYTTKPTGEGTGLGMSISYKVIKAHKGDIKIESTKGVGTKFIIILPISLKES